MHIVIAALGGYLVLNGIVTAWLWYRSSGRGWDRYDWGVAVFGAVPLTMICWYVDVRTSRVTIPSLRASSFAAPSMALPVHAEPLTQVEARA